MDKKLEFKISSGLKDIIGKDLITDDYVAIFELVKNSYDAHAKKVVITFETNSIRIVDNGKGMSFNDLQDKWLFVAYSAKRDGSEDADIIKNGKHPIKYPFSLLYFHCTFAFAILHELLTYFHYDTRTI